MSIKAHLIELAEKLPEEATYETVLHEFYRLYVIEKFEKGSAEIGSAEETSHADLKKRFKQKWQR